MTPEHRTAWMTRVKMPLPVQWIMALQVGCRGCGWGRAAEQQLGRPVGRELEEGTKAFHPAKLVRSSVASLCRCGATIGRWWTRWSERLPTHRARSACAKLKLSERTSEMNLAVRSMAATG